MSEPMNIDQSLDDIIRNKAPAARRAPPSHRRSDGGGGGGGYRSGLRIGGVHRAIVKTGRRSGDYSMDLDRDRWQHDKYRPDSGGMRKPRGRDDSSMGSKIVVTNLDKKVTHGDINDLFKSVGPIKQGMVIYDGKGESTGTAEVVFVNKEDALDAIKKYNGVPLDNRPLSITLSTVHSSDGPSRSSAPQRAITSYVDLDDPEGQGPQINSKPVIRTVRQPRYGMGSRRGGRGGGGGGGRFVKDKRLPTKEELDAELDSMVEKPTTNAAGNGQDDGEGAMEDN